MKIGDIIQLLEKIAPPEYKEEYDNVGLLTGSLETVCTAVLVSLDCTEQVVNEAIHRNCNLIVCHHPLIFRPLRTVLPLDGTGKTLISAIRAGISVYAIHTNLDNVFSGVNAAFADRLGLINRKILLPASKDPLVGSGMVGELKESVTEPALLALLKEKFGVPVIRHSALTGRMVKRMAICGGAGSFLISNALRAKADFFISADIRYHDFFAGDGVMVIADIGHYESEQFTIDLLHDVILEKFTNFAVLKSGTETNPVKYYI